ncbi:1-acyl-sn-glycerol-3-phosphate acyltransferase [Arcanobacterium wilhelmae]|uniref:1-acyl-sn-glycerol-3-phosphate acyltransferase n=1 Tax=Arcanobacterium wilhelmae TaxID=1803177 RepID=A0ABT9NAT7_9ACTO|nr:1-acyl-sn-glycerol-3-phosphate acyltransferase [Arcanobacterium wilhelmae]MDP9800828.1 1-acyl-sn-glycerol-3-phosphate acyltransferase [Arcanobacterium wilhelmae]
MKHAASKLFQKVSRWTFVHEPLPEKAVVIGAPHTSVWDGIFMAVAFWDLRRDFKFLVKDSLTHGPVAPLIKWVGGLGVDRKHPHGMVGSTVEKAKETEGFTLIIAPEGTRKQRKYWRSGFYHIALQANVPVVLGFIDAKTRTYGWGPSIELTGDVKADMDVIRAFYADKVGMRDGRVSAPRLRAEDEPEAAGAAGSADSSADGTGSHDRAGEADRTDSEGGAA